jgi:adenylate kinase
MLQVPWIVLVSFNAFTFVLGSMYTIMTSRASTGVSLAHAELNNGEIKTEETVPEAGVSTPESLDIVFVLGGPGSGKGTQCAKIAEKFGFIHLSSSDRLRKEANSGSELGKDVGVAMASGSLVPQAPILDLLRQAIEKSGAKKIIIDGYPRTLDQAKEFEESICPARQVLFFDMDEETLKGRLLKLGETSGSADDNVESIVNCLSKFNEESLPVVSFYSKLGNLRKIDGRYSVETVFAQTIGYFESPSDPAVGVEITITEPNSVLEEDVEIEKLAWTPMPIADP